MTALILSILANPTVIAILAAIAGAFGFGIYKERVGASKERAKQAAKERDSYAKHLQDIERAAAAKPRGGVSGDPHNRDSE